MLEITTTRLQELGMSNVADIVSAIRKDVEASIERVETSTSQEKDDQALLMTALERALQNNREVRRYFGDMTQTNAISRSILAEVEGQMAAEDGQHWCDQCINWHPRTRHSPSAL